MKNNFIPESIDPGKFILIGISCHLKEYRFCWLLNRQLGIELVRVKDLQVTQPGNTEISNEVPVYFCDENIRQEQILLLSNHGPGGKLLERYSQADYLLFVKDISRKGGAGELLREVKKIEQVLTAFTVAIKDEQAIIGILTDLELLLMDHKKQKN